MYFNSVLSKLEGGGFTLFSSDYTPSALTEVHGKNLTDFRETISTKAQRGVLSSRGCVGGCRDGCSSARYWPGWLCTPGSAWGTEQGWLCPTSPDLPTFICTSPAGCDLTKSKKTLKKKKISAIPGSFLCAFSPPGSSHTLLLQGNHFLLYSYWKKSVLLLSSSTDPSWHYSNESDVKSELCHVPPHCVKDYAIQKPVATQ